MIIDGVLAKVVHSLVKYVTSLYNPYIVTNHLLILILIITSPVRTGANCGGELGSMHTGKLMCYGGTVVGLAVLGD